MEIESWSKLIARWVQGMLIILYISEPFSSPLLSKISKYTELVFLFKKLAVYCERNTQSGGIEIVGRRWGNNIDIH
jgi:hypothetical protein